MYEDNCGASRLGQSPLSCCFHFIMFALYSYFSISLNLLGLPFRIVARIERSEIRGIPYFTSLNAGYETSNHPSWQST
jgi:hypothetical protein